MPGAGRIRRVGESRPGVKRRRWHPGVPVLTLAEVPLLDGKPPVLLRVILRINAVFPDARLLEGMPQEANFVDPFS